MKKWLCTFATLLMALCTFATTSFAWFSNRVLISYPSSYGSTQAAYFAGGDGSKDDPYLIGSSVHLYNLAWLQYLGYFNLKDGFNNGRAQNYFRLSASIDCSGLSIPPIGTSEYPFIGNFDGNGNVLYNVTVSNASEDLPRRPTNAKFKGDDLYNTQESESVSIVGLFGATGDYNQFVTDKYKSDDIKDSVENPAESVPSNAADTDFYYAAMSIEGFYINNLHIRSGTAKTLVGLLAGYVGCSVQNTGVYVCDVSINGTATGLNDSYGTCVSKYSIVGDYDEKVVGWSERPKDEMVEGGDQGDSATWGGSIDMRTLNRRLTYMIANVVKTKPSGYSGYVAEDDNTSWGIKAFRSGRAEFYWNPMKENAGSYAVLYLDSGTLLPINVNGDEMGLNKTDEKTNKTTGFHYNEYYSDKTSEVISNSNTGYIVGGGNKNNGYIRSRVQPLATGTTNEIGIYKSLGFTKSQSGGTLYNAATFEMVTLGSDGEWYRIKDKYNNGITQTALTNYTQREYNDTSLGLASGGTVYDKVRASFDASMEGAYVAHGFHFKKLNKEIETTTAEVNILGKTYSNYPLVEGGINFTLQEKGIIKTIVGSFFQSSMNSLFDLYKATRTTSGTSTTLTLERIKNIYQNSSGDVQYNQDNAPTGYTKVFDFDNLAGTDCLETGVAYYFEIPVTAGDYVIAADNTSTGNNAYLMYLDIGANGDEGGDDTTTTPGGEASKTPYTISMVDFVSVQDGVEATDGSELSVPTADGEYYFPYYKDVTFRISDASSGNATETIQYKRRSYDATLLPTTLDKQIATAVAYMHGNNVTVMPTPTFGLAIKDDSLQTTGTKKSKKTT